MVELKPYIVEIEEVFRRKVIIWETDTGSAAARAEELCDSGEINMERNCYDGRIAVTSGVADENELCKYEQYGGEDKIMD